MEQKALELLSLPVWGPAYKAEQEARSVSLAPRWRYEFKLLSESSAVLPSQNQLPSASPTVRIEGPSQSLPKAQNLLQWASGYGPSAAAAETPAPARAAANFRRGVFCLDLVPQ